MSNKELTMKLETYRVNRGLGSTDRHAIRRAEASRIAKELVLEQKRILTMLATGCEIAR